VEGKRKRKIIPQESESVCGRKMKSRALNDDQILSEREPL
jgi:hypothetical protein